MLGPVVVLTNTGDVVGPFDDEAAATFWAQKGVQTHQFASYTLKTLLAPAQ